MSLSRSVGLVCVVGGVTTALALGCSVENDGQYPGPAPAAQAGTSAQAPGDAGAGPKPTAAAGATSVAGNSSTSGAGGAGGNPGTAGVAGQIAETAGAATTAGAGGVTTTGGAAGAATTAGTGGGLEPGDTPPWRDLNITATEDEHKHGGAGVDTRAKSLGKLVVDIGVNAGGYSGWLAKRGYHSMGAPCGACDAPNLGAGRDEVGTCRLGEFANTEKSVKAQLAMLEGLYPQEGWGYFLNKDGSVRWSDVAITGISHGATTAAIAGRIGARMWRVVSRSGPRDNTCGLGSGKCTAPISTPSYEATCADKEVASWIDQPSKTPMNRFYSIVGMGDGQCGDIMFHQQRAKYIGKPVIYDVAGAVLTGTNQFFSQERGHDDYLAAPTITLNNEAVLNIAFGIPPENQNPKF